LVIRLECRCERRPAPFHWFGIFLTKHEKFSPASKTNQRELPGAGRKSMADQGDFWDHIDLDGLSEYELFPSDSLVGAEEDEAQSLPLDVNLEPEADADEGNALHVGNVA